MSLCPVYSQSEMLPWRRGKKLKRIVGAMLASRIP
jgi:hypothetical protein